MCSCALSVEALRVPCVRCATRILHFSAGHTVALSSKTGHCRLKRGRRIKEAARACCDSAFGQGASGRSVLCSLTRRARPLATRAETAGRGCARVSHKHVAPASPKMWCRPRWWDHSRRLRDTLQGGSSEHVCRGLSRRSVCFTHSRGFDRGVTQVAGAFVPMYVAGSIQ